MTPLRVICAAAAGLVVATGSVAHANTRTPACTTHGLVVWLDTNGNGTAGSTFYKLRLTNLSGRRCVLVGYPGVSAVDLVGRRLGSAARRDVHVHPTSVTLAPGRTADAVLQVADTGVFAKTLCRPVTAAGLRVYPPNETRSRIVPFPFRACSQAGPVYMRVQSVTASP